MDLEVLTFLYNHRGEEYYTEQLVKQLKLQHNNIASNIERLSRWNFIEKNRSVKISGMISRFTITEKGIKLVDLMVERDEWEQQ